MSQGVPAIARAAEEVAARLRQRLGDRLPLARDRAALDELAVEARPVAEALLEGLAGAGRDLDAPELREGLAMGSLLGRRAALLGVTPTGALQIAPCLVAVLREVAPDHDGLAPALGGHRARGEAATRPAASSGPASVASLDGWSPPLLARLSAVLLEGYVGAREEQLDERAARRAAEAVPVVEVVAGCFAVLPSGDQEADELERVFEELGRRLLNGNARALLVHAAGLRRPDRERAGQLYALHATCRMLGVTCVFSGVPEAWQAAARERGVELTDVHHEPTFAAGLEAALEACGLEVRDRGGMLRRFVGRRDKR